MVLEVIFLKSAVPCGEIAVVQEVVRHIVANVSENATTVDRGRGIPIIEEYGMGELPERCSEHNEERRRHDQSVFVHRKVVVDTVEKEMQCDSYPIVRKVAIEELA